MPSRFISSVIDQQDKTDPKKAKADIFNFHKDSSTNLLIEHDKKEIECETEKKKFIWLDGIQCQNSWFIFS